jgi:hypothetical protein
MLVFFVISLLALKAFSIISVSWTIVIIIFFAMAAVDACLHEHQKIILSSIKAIDELQHQIDDIKDK